jgi:hypothetical protein
MEHWWYDIDKRKTKCPEKTLSQCHLSNTNKKGADLASNLGLRGEKPVTHRLSHGMASLKTKTSLKYI